MSFLSLPRTLLSSFFRPSSSSSSSSMIISHSSIFSNSFSTSSINQLMRKPTHQKLKTHKGAAKRWLAIGNGNFKRSKAGSVHLLSSKSPTRLNRLGQTVLARPIEKKLLRRLLPYA